MSRDLVLLPEAEEELLQAMRWYEAQRAGLGVEFIGVIEAALETIAENAEAFPVWEPAPRYRRRVIRRFPYCVFYEIRGLEAEIAAIAHAKRDPNYWIARKSH